LLVAHGGFNRFRYDDLTCHQWAGEIQRRRQFAGVLNRFVHHVESGSESDLFLATSGRYEHQVRLCRRRHVSADAWQLLGSHTRARNTNTTVQEQHLRYYLFTMRLFLAVVLLVRLIFKINERASKKKERKERKEKKRVVFSFWETLLGHRAFIPNTTPK
jgi:hypothetical protein